MALPDLEYDWRTDLYVTREPEPEVNTADLLNQVIANTPEENHSYQKYEPVVNKPNFWEKQIRASEVILDQERLLRQRKEAYYRSASNPRFNPSICHICGGIDPDCPNRSR